VTCIVGMAFGRNETVDFSATSAPAWPFVEHIKQS